MHQKFKNLYDYRLDRSPDGLERALSERGTATNKYAKTPPVKTPKIQVITPVTYQKEIAKPSRYEFARNIDSR